MINYFVSNSSLNEILWTPFLFCLLSELELDNMEFEDWDTIAFDFDWCAADKDLIGLVLFALQIKY
jgi:hypothetical protein